MGDETVRPDPSPGDLPPDEAVDEARAEDEAARKARERVSPAATDEAEMVSREFTGQHPLKHRQAPVPTGKSDDWQKPSEGALELRDAEGAVYAPIACGVHRSAPSFREPDGFQSDCAACQSELSSTLESIQRYATV